MRNAFLWLLGGFGAASWQALAVFAAYAVVPLAAIGLSARALDLIALGDEPAHHLGADVDRIRRLVYVCTALLTAASVATCGIIGFVGLVVPHAVRTRGAAAAPHPAPPGRSSPAGAFLVLSDVVARTVVRPLELPVGVITALVGVPLFALLLRRSARMILEARDVSRPVRASGAPALDGVSCAVRGGELVGRRRTQRQRQDHAGARCHRPPPARGRGSDGRWTPAAALEARRSSPACWPSFLSGRR